MITPSFGLTATERVLPKLALDFTTSSLDSRVTFTRSGNTATVTNSSGLIAAVNADVPRFDFDPITLVCKGLLIEEQRTNLATYSAQFDNAAWTPSNCTVTANTAMAPDGTTSGDSLIVSNQASNQGISSSNFTADGTSSYTGSVYIRKTGSVPGLIYFRPGIVSGNTYSQLSFNTETGFVSFTDASSTSSSYSVTDVNGWWRITITAGGIPAGNMQFHVRLINRPVSTTVELWGAQVEAGAFATSYIPTVASQVTRTADVATMTGTNFSDWYSAGAGGVAVRVLPSTVSGIRPALQFDDATADEVIVLRGSTTNPELVIVDGGFPQAQIDAGTIAVSTSYNLGAAWDTDNCAAAVNGGAAVTDTTATIPTVTQARLGSDGVNYLNGQLQTVRYWPQRIINAEVQAFSKG